MHTSRGDGVAGIKRRRRDLSSDGVRNLATASGRDRLKEDLESSTWRRRQDFKATPTARLRNDILMFQQHQGESFSEAWTHFKDLLQKVPHHEERVKQLEECMGVIRSDFMQLSLKVVEKLKDEIKAEENRVKKIKKITRYPDTEDPKPSSNLKLLETLTKSTSFHALDFISSKSLCVKYVRTIFPSPPLVRESTFGFKPGANNDRNFKYRYDAEN
ncbi:hypothetical protein Tco_0698052 [Tanacetum coccineum]